MIYDIYHDESKEEAYWHGFYFVPRDNRQYLLDLLNEAREKCDYFSQIHYKNIKSDTKSHGKKATIMKAWTSIGIASIQQQKLVKNPPPVYLGHNPKKREPVYRRLDTLIKCKLVIFKEKDKHEKMFFQDDNLRNIEITFKMALKGALHRLFNDENKITVGNIYIDGDEHYMREYRRNINTEEIINRLKIEKREYIDFLEDSRIIPQKSDHKKIKKLQDENDSHLLQLCDILIGGVRVHSYCPYDNMTRYRVSEQCKWLLEHDQNNMARMANSRYFNGFLLNEAWLENGEWKFGQLASYRDKCGQKPLFDYGC